MSFKSVFFGLAVLVSASSISMAQSMPNYGPNPPSNTDRFGQVPSGAKPPGVSRYGHRAYAYVPNQHRHHSAIGITVTGIDESAKTTVASRPFRYFAGLSNAALSRFRQTGDVCFHPKSGHLQCTSPCPLSANSGHGDALCGLGRFQRTGLKCCAGDRDGCGHGHRLRYLRPY